MISNKLNLLVLAAGVLLLNGCGSPELEKIDNVDAANDEGNQTIETGMASAAETTESNSGIDTKIYNAASEQTIPQNLKNIPKLTAFYTAARQTDILKLLSKTGPYTVLVPTDEAFEALPGGTFESLMDPENKEQLIDLLSNHIIAGRLDEASLQNETSIKTIGNAKLKVMRKDDRAMINGAEVVKSDLESRNGVMHIVDKVLIPDKNE
jgi:uncharacterized surface protein with fasciclin (FAS1) repeats